jgi:hypothetical protein
VLPLSLVAVHVIYKLEISWPAWIAALAVAIASAAPIWFWRTGRTDQALAAYIFGLSVQFAVFMTIAAPAVGAKFSERDLAAHFNAQGQVPPHVLLVEERVASIAFYLDPKLRAELRPRQLEAFRLAQLEELPAAEPGTVVAVPERRLEQTARYVNLAGVPFQAVGQYRLYEAGPLTRAVMASANAKARLATRPALTGDAQTPILR